MGGRVIPRDACVVLGGGTDRTEGGSGGGRLEAGSGGGLWLGAAAVGPMPRIVCGTSRVVVLEVRESEINAASPTSADMGIDGNRGALNGDRNVPGRVGGSTSSMDPSGRLIARSISKSTSRFVGGSLRARGTTDGTNAARGATDRGLSSNLRLARST